ncbi:MAG: thermonuclease family protein [Cyanobacteria bacterium J06600_6]
MNFKTILNGSVLFVGLGLTAYAWLNGYRVRLNVEDVAVDSSVQEQEEGIIPEEWQVKPGSIYDGDTLRVVRGNEELKIRFCGIDAPEKKQELGIKSRDHLRSLVDIGNGGLLIVPIEKDRYNRTVAEVYVKDSRSTAINLNVQMVRDGYAWHYERYSGNCPIRGEFAIAQELAQDEGLGIWNGSPQPPWEWRKANK